MLFKKLLIIVILLSLLAGGGYVYVHTQLDQEAIKQEIKKTVEQSLANINIGMGEILFDLSINPSIRINDVVLSSDLDKEDKPLAQVNSILIRTNWYAILSGNITFDDVELIDTSLYMHYGLNEVKNWQYIENILNNKDNDLMNDIEFKLVNTTITYQNDVKAIAQAITDINVNVAIDSASGPYEVNGSITLNNQPYRITLEAESLTEAESDINFQLSNQYSLLSINAVMGIQENNFMLEGKFSLTGKDIGLYIASLVGLDQEYNELEIDDNSFSLTADIQVNNHNIRIDDIIFDGKNSIQTYTANSKDNTPTGETANSKENFINIDLKNGALSEANLNLQHINFDYLFYATKTSNISIINTVIPDLSMLFDIHVNKVIYKKSPITDLFISGQMAGGTFELFPLVAKMPDDGNIKVRGSLSQRSIGNNKNMAISTFNGDLLINGNNIAPVLQWLDIKMKDEDEDEKNNENFSKFSISTDITMVPYRTELNNISFTGKNSELKGDMKIRYGGTRTKINSNFDISNIDFALFEKLNFDEYASITNEKIPEAIRIRNLTRIPYNIDSRFYISQVNLNNEQFNNLSFSLHLSDRKIALEDLQINSIKNKLQTNLIINIEDDQMPRLNLEIEADRLDSSFVMKEQPMEDRIKELYAEFKQKQKNEIIETNDQFTYDGSIRWSTLPINLSSLLLINGDVSINIKKYRHKHLLLDNVSMNGVINQNKLIVNRFGADFIDGEITIDNMIIGHSITNYWSANFRANNININKLVSIITGNKKPSLNGIANISASINSSGSTVRSWLERMNGQIAIAPSNLTISGFNFEYLIKNIERMQTQKNLIQLINSTIKGKASKGSMKFKPFTVTADIQEGRLVFNNLSLNSKNSLYNANAVGVIDLYRWILKIKSVFVFAPVTKYPPQEFLQREKGGIVVNINVETSSIDNPLIELYYTKIVRYWAAIRQEMIRLKKLEK